MTRMRDRLDRDLLTVDQAIARQTELIDVATAKRMALEAERRALLAAYAALQGMTP